MKKPDIPLKYAGNFTLPILGIGTYGMGGRLERDPRADDQRDITAMKEALKMGLTHIDTAEVYAEGFAEVLIGQAIQEFDRKKLIIVSKVYPNNLHYGDVIKSCRQSLDRLGITYLNLYLIHGPHHSTPLKETMKAFDYLLENELIQDIGVSNFDIPLIQEAQSYTKYKIVNNQIHYSLVARSYEDNGTLKYCQENNQDPI